jgi:hypothetical protein
METEAQVKAHEEAIAMNKAFTVAEAIVKAEALALVTRDLQMLQSWLEKEQKSPENLSDKNVTDLDNKTITITRSTKIQRLHSLTHSGQVLPLNAAGDL